jgi:transcriptional regulator with XRE-family HTH domain
MFFHTRLKEERKRLRLTQAELAGIGGTTKGSQGKYENGENTANSGYLSRIAAAGVDVQYILTGVRSDVALLPDEKYLLGLYREAPPGIRKAAIAALASGSPSGGVNQTVTIGGDNRGTIAGVNIA